jgi:NADPH:quinone reductase-like Zn-dependent oxidoreductase
LLAVLGKGLTIRGYTLFEFTRDPLKLATAKDAIYGWLESAQLKPVIGKTFPFEQIVEAHRYLESNQQLGKIVVTV